MQGSKIRTEQRGVGPNEGREVVEGNYARLEIKVRRLCESKEIQS